MAKKKISPINEDFDLKLFVTIAQKNMLWFFLFMISSMVIGLAILRYTAPIFESSSIIKIADENNAQNVLGITGADRLANVSNQIAGDIELIRSKVIVERAIKHLPLFVSYYSKGAVLVYELYKQNPFTVECIIRDSSIYHTPIFVDFKSVNSCELNYTSPKTGEKISSAHEPGKWFSLPEGDFRISITDYKEIKETQKELNKDAYYFEFNRISEVSNQIIRDLSVTVLNPDAKTVLIKLKDKNNKKAADIVNGIAVEFNKLMQEKCKGN